MNAEANNYKRAMYVFNLNPELYIQFDEVCRDLVRYGKGVGKTCGRSVI